MNLHLALDTLERAAALSMEAFGANISPLAEAVSVGGKLIEPPKRATRGAIGVKGVYGQLTCTVISVETPCCPVA